MAFLDEKYLLTNETAVKIFEKIEGLPILDPHNHADLKEIAENKNYSDIWFVEAATDHYVWELLRKRGVDEKFITGNATNKEKWMQMAKVFPELVGNPTYEWVHLDLKRRFKIDLLINEDNAQTIWDNTKAFLEKESSKPQEILKQMKVETMCSTDDPIDMLEYHKEMQNVKDVNILPTWRPDKSMNIFKKDFVEYIGKLEKRVGNKISNIDELVAALQETHDYFEKMGTKASDHGIEIPFGYKVEKDVANAAFIKKLNGESLTQDDIENYMSYMLHQFGEMNSKSGWVTQLHIGAVRDVRDSLFNAIGPDTGGDVSDHSTPILKQVKDFLNAFDGRLKIVLYSMDPNHWTTLATLTRAFGKDVNLGAAWWLNDTPVGMKRQLEYISSIDLFTNYAGMVSDSRKLMSYGSRTEMFRRVLSDVLGNMVERGQIPKELAIKTAVYLCYERKKELFGF